MFEKEKAPFTDYLINFRDHFKKDPPYSQEDIYDFLDNLVRHQYDREVAEELYENMIKNEKNLVSFHEFIHVYFEAEKILQKQLEESSKKMINLKNEREEIQRNYDEAFRFEKLDSFGLSYNNELILKIDRIENNSIDSNIIGKQVYIMIENEDNDEKFISEKFLLENNSIYNVNYTSKFFKIRPNSVLKICLLTEDSYSNNYLIGSIIENINQYQDQITHFETRNLINKKQQNTNIILYFNINWFYSKTKHFSDGLKKWDDKIEFEEEKLIYLKKKLNVIYEPLRLMNVNEQEIKFVDNKKNNDYKIANNIGSMYWKEKTKQFLLLYLFIIAIVCFMRACFLDIGIIIGIIHYLNCDLLTKNKIKLILILFFIIIVIDIIWLSIFRFDSWVNNSFVLNQNIDSNLKYCSLIASYIALAYKFLLCIVFNKFSEYCPE